MEDLDNILNDILGEATTPAPPCATPTSSPEEQVETDETSFFSNEDLSEILQSNNITQEPNDDTEVENIEESTEEPTDTTVNTEAALEAEVENTDTTEDSSTDNAQPEEPVNDFTIPENSPTILIDDSTARFSGAEWYEAIQRAEVIIAGLGGIGSHLALQIGRMHPNKMVLYDDDTVDTVNMSGQLYPMHSVGTPKTTAMMNQLRKYASIHNVFAVENKFTYDSVPADIMLCGFDNMEARKTYFNSWLRHVKTKATEEQKAKCLYIDGRLSMDTLQVLCITGNDEYCINRYQNEFLFSDEEADATVCSMKQTTYMACMIGAIMTNLFTNFIANSIDPVIPYSLPFFTEYNAQFMMFKTED